MDELYQCERLTTVSDAIRDREEATFCLSSNVQLLQVMLVLLA